MPIAVDPAQTNTTAQATLDTNRVVVLPFKVIGGAQDSADLGYGLVSTLTSKLQPLQNLGGDCQRVGPEIQGQRPVP